MTSFEVRGRDAAARLGRFTTRHGAVTTPTLLPVLNPNIAYISAREMRSRFGTQMVITNSYVIRKHQALREKALAEGVHKLIDWDGPVMTDSGTFQMYVYGKVQVQPDEIVAFQRDIGVDVGTILDIFSTPDRT
ncbi:MAG TPA: tRNA-guanine transglycosylase, partial [Candidatus Thermoplasmatota archaeon]|nr:tRNA-guanine transglycosylase [Candidatus Thermoplasmatota archaeon]